jgi:hypothetical protein
LTAYWADEPLLQPGGRIQGEPRFAALFLKNDEITSPGINEMLPGIWEMAETNQVRVAGPLRLGIGAIARPLVWSPRGPCAVLERDSKLL